MDTRYAFSRDLLDDVYLVRILLGNSTRLDLYRTRRFPAEDIS